MAQRAAHTHNQQHCLDDSSWWLLGDARCSAKAWHHGLCSKNTVHYSPAAFPRLGQLLLLDYRVRCELGLVSSIFPSLPFALVPVPHCRLGTYAVHAMHNRGTRALLTSPGFSASGACSHTGGGVITTTCCAPAACNCCVMFSKLLP